jgi:hypothetical protein
MRTGEEVTALAEQAKETARELLAVIDELNALVTFRNSNEQG